MTGCQYGAITKERLPSAYGLREAGLVHHLPGEGQFRERARAAGKNQVRFAALDQGHQTEGKTLRAHFLNDVTIGRTRPDDAGDADGVPTGFPCAARRGFHQAAVAAIANRESRFGQQAP